MTEETHNSIAEELRKINAQLGALAEGQARQGQELTEIKIQVRATNGRVTTLEAQRIAQEAVDAERQRMADHMEDTFDDAEDSRQKNIDRAITIVIGLAGVIAGVFLANGGVF